MNTQAPKNIQPQTQASPQKLQTAGSSLPKIQHPTFSITIPSTQKEVKFRPFLVREEKILLMMQESKNFDEIAAGIKQIINNCALQPLDVESLYIYDIEFIFLQLRSRSVSNTAVIKWRDSDDNNKEHEFEINLDEVKIITPADHNASGKIMLTDTLGIKMKPINYDFYKKYGKGENSKDPMKIIKDCIDFIFDSERTYPFSLESSESQTNWVESLSAEQSRKIAQYFENQPKLQHVIPFKNSKGEEKTLTIVGLENFIQ